VWGFISRKVDRVRVRFRREYQHGQEGMCRSTWAGIPFGFIPRLACWIHADNLDVAGIGVLDCTAHIRHDSECAARTPQQEACVYHELVPYPIACGVINTYCLSVKVRAKLMSISMPLVRTTWSCR